MFSFLRIRTVQTLTVVLLAQASLFYGFSRRETIPAHKPLADFQFDSPEWAAVQDIQTDPETLEVLKADDLVTRVYQNTRTRVPVTLFVAFFETQRTGKAPHSPKNCLPGSGWVPSQAGMMNIPITGEASPITVNRYVVSRGQNQSLVLYWYQAHDHVIASEYAAKIYTVTDSIRYHRSDTSLVRVVVDVRDGDVDGATKVGENFVQAMFEPLKHYLPA